MFLRSAKPVQVVLNARFHGSEFDVTTGLAQMRQVGLSKALLRTFQMIGERDVTDLALAMPLDHGVGDIVEALRPP